MSWKKAVFTGGAVLLLAACADSTAPTGPTELKKVNSSNANFLGATSTILPTTTTPTDPNTKPVTCNYVVRVGIDGTVIVLCIPVVME